MPLGLFSPVFSARAPVHAENTGENSPDRKSTRLNSSHSQISYAVFCLKKKKKHQTACSSSHADNCRMQPPDGSQASLKDVDVYYRELVHVEFRVASEFPCDL